MTWHYTPWVVWEAKDDTVYVTTPDVGDILLLQGSAFLVWTELPGRTTEALIDELAALAQIEADDIADDVHTFVMQLFEQGLIESRADD